MNICLPIVVFIDKVHQSTVRGALLCTECALKRVRGSYLRKSSLFGGLFRSVEGLPEMCNK